MSAENDPALYKSEFERIEGDRYWTEHWLTTLLLQKLGVRLLEMEGRVWEPAAGRGDIIHVLQDYGLDTLASDIDLSEFDTGACPCFESDFRTAMDVVDILMPDIDSGLIKAVVSNPPFGKLAPAFLRHMLSIDTLDVVAVLLRSEFNSGQRVSELYR